MRTFILTVLLLCNLAQASDNYFAAQYTLLFSPDRAWTYGEGIQASYSMTDKKTRISGGFFHTKIKGENTTGVIPLGLEADLSLGDVPIHASLDVPNLSYSTKRTKNIYDILLFGDYNLWSKNGFVKKDILLRRWSFDLWSGFGMKIDMTNTMAEHTLFIDDKKIDSIVNPVSNSKSSGIKFYLSNSASMRFGVILVDVKANTCFYDFKKSYFSMGFGGSF